MGSWGYFSVWKKIVFQLETERFLPIIGDKSRKGDCKLTGLATDESLSNFVRSSSDVESGTPGQMRCQHLTNAFGGMDTLAIV